MKPDLYWMPNRWQGKLAIATRPRGGEWLEDELRSWKDAGLDIVVSLLDPDEARHLGLEDEALIARSVALKSRSFPIPDRGVPGSDDGFRRLMADLTADLAAGRNVAIHCRQGVGRSGMAAAGLLIASGLSAQEAAEMVSRARGVRVPETPEQLRWLETLASGHLTPA